MKLSRRMTLVLTAFVAFIMVMAFMLLLEAILANMASALLALMVVV